MPSKAASTGIGSLSGVTDQPVARNSPPLSIQVRERIGRTTIPVITASVQATQYQTIASTGSSGTSSTA